MYTRIINRVYMQDNYAYMQDDYVYIITHFFTHVNFFYLGMYTCILNYVYTYTWYT